MTKIMFGSAAMKRCEKLGHDWAFKDCDTFMTKICLRCGCEQYFFPEDVEE